MQRRAPGRLRWAVEVLAVEPGDRILEIGCGTGAAVDLVCQRLHSGYVTGLDRSKIAIRAARARNRHHVRAGKARFVEKRLADLDLRRQFDKVFAVNVNCFWLGPDRELEAIRRALAPGGRLYLFYEPPSARQLARASKGCAAFLEAQGFRIIEVLRGDLLPNLGLGIIAEPQPRTS
jgi:SAM-dependent methyltransferase